MSSIKIENKTHFPQVIGLEDAEQVLKERIALPLKFPQLFTKSSYRHLPNVLLYGSSGTGKQYLINTFFSSIKETLITLDCKEFESCYEEEATMLFNSCVNQAIAKNPSVIYFKNIEVLGHNCLENQEPVLRLMRKSFFLFENELRWKRSIRNLNVFFLASTKKPWLIDFSLLRKLQIRLYISLPSEQNRFQLFTKFISEQNLALSEVHLTKLARLSKDFSGADIKYLIQKTLEKIKLDEDSFELNIRENNKKLFTTNKGEFKYSRFS
eukprot:snap_masked-scaffold_3-processed-gene-21.72-mRNA-1 protein AED:0.37 eAED:0.38 QI:0/0/0/0.5/1/1/2/0/267